MKTRLVASATTVAAALLIAAVFLWDRTGSFGVWGPREHDVIEETATPVGRTDSLGVSGPQEHSIVVEGAPTPIETYANGGRSRLAVLLTRTDKGWGWLAFAHALKSWGVPFMLTRDWRAAAAHRVIAVFPDLTDAGLPAEALSRSTLSTAWV